MYVLNIYVEALLSYMKGAVLHNVITRSGAHAFQCNGHRQKKGGLRVTRGPRL